MEYLVDKGLFWAYITCFLCHCAIEKYIFIIIEIMCSKNKTFKCQIKTENRRDFIFTATATAGAVGVGATEGF